MLLDKCNKHKQLQVRKHFQQHKLAYAFKPIEIQHVSSLTWMGHNKLAPESSLSFKVHHQTAFFIDSHAGWVHGACERQKDLDECQKTSMQLTWSEASLFGFSTIVVLKSYARNWPQGGNVDLSTTLCHLVFATQTTIVECSIVIAYCFKYLYKETYSIC